MPVAHTEKWAYERSKVTRERDVTHLSHGDSENLGYVQERWTYYGQGQALK